jgi:PAS domain S-box-containing protein
VAVLLVPGPPAAPGDDVEPGPAARATATGAGPRGLVAYVLDVDEQRRAADAARELDTTLAAIFNASPDIIAIVGSDGVVHTMSPAAERVAGWPAERLVGRRALSLIHPDDHAELAQVDARLQAGEPNVVVRYRAEHADGRTLVLEAQCSLMEEGDGATGIVLVARDITERAELEEAQVAARVAAEAANRSKSEFLSRMSHELRTPLNAVLGFAQLLEIEDLTPAQRESTTQILRGGRHLLELIDEVLDISRIETGRLALALEPVLLGEAVRDALDLVRPLADRHGIELVAPRSPACDGVVVADRQRLRQVLVHVLANAVEYNRPRGTVSVSCEESSGTALVHVADTGRGIRAEHLGLVFTPFERLDAAQSNIEGAGIGLALSRRLAEAMGGSIEVASTFGEGSTFTVGLVLAEGRVG